MKIYRDISEIENRKGAVVTVGTFDGIHKGHTDIINLVVSEAAEGDKESFVVTFEPHPRLVVSDNYNIKLLTVFEEKAVLFERLNVQNLLVINFNMEFANIPYEEFVKSYLIDKINADHIVIGHDHKFGKGRGGDENKLAVLSEKFGFKLTVVKAVSDDGTEVSSSKIRNALIEGDLLKANSYLGRNYSLHGIVVAGVQRGRELGFPTANIEPLNKQKLVPAIGVYAVECNIEGNNHSGVLNIGKRPTFEDQEKVFIELHLFGFENDIYGKPVFIEFVERIRDEVKFNSTDELKEQIKKDIIKAKQILNKSN